MAKCGTLWTFSVLGGCLLSSSFGSATQACQIQLVRSSSAQEVRREWRGCT